MSKVIFESSPRVCPRITDRIYCALLEVASSLQDTFRRVISGRALKRAILVKRPIIPQSHASQNQAEPH